MALSAIPEEDRIVSSQELAQELVNLPKQVGYPTGFSGLDYYLREFREGDLVIITGLTGEGKTQFGVSLSKKMIANGQSPLWFSFEISSQELFERFGSHLPLFYLPRLITSKAGTWIEKKIEEAKKAKDIKVVFIDHLHYLTDDQSVRNHNLSEILGNLCRQFKFIARKHRLTIFVLAHTRKVRSERNRPTIDDLKDSSGIAQEADTVLVIHRTGKKRSRKTDASDIPELSTDIRVWIDKNRRTGMLGFVDMYFDPSTMMHIQYGEDETEVEPPKPAAPVMRAML